MAATFHIPSSFQPAPAHQVGLLVTQELEQAIAICRAKVTSLAQECKASNRRFRDIEFDLIEDGERCLHGLNYNKESPIYSPKDVRRVTDIFDKPSFTIAGATPGDICQGKLSNCWFLSALAVIGTVSKPGDNATVKSNDIPTLINQICVAMDEKVGIYGFIFWRDSGWVGVIIDDYLYTSVPPWEDLSPTEKLMHHDDKNGYNATARKGGSNLYFAKCKTENETWVPLLEKAYAKLHGDYHSLHGGFTSEGVEDLTGGVSTLIFVKDILDTEAFWKDELMLVGKDRVFACFTPDSSLSGDEGERPMGLPTPSSADNGLAVNHAYSVIQAVEFTPPGAKVRRKFLRVRNPWGRTEWTGKWSDGSGEWNVKWANKLKRALGNYSFGNDGEFVMEYQDFLESWGVIERSRLFNGSWRMSSQWLKVPAGGKDHVWGHGDVSYTINVTQDAEAIIVLAQLDKRYFKELSGRYKWGLDFTLFRKDDASVVGRSFHSAMWERSVKMEAKLKTGIYVVQVRLDRTTVSTDKSDLGRKPGWDDRNFSRKYGQLLLSQSIAANFDATATLAGLPMPSEIFEDQDITELEMETGEALLKRWEVVKQRSSQGAKSTASDGTTASTHLQGKDSREPKPESVVDGKIEEPSGEERPVLYSLGAGTGAGDRTWPDSEPAPSLQEDSPMGVADAASTTSHSSSFLQDAGRYTHTGFVCSRCSGVPTGTMHVCTHVTCKCVRYILCEPCMKATVHEAGHKFIQSRSASDDEAIGKHHPKGECWDDLVIGLRVYTNSSETVVEGQLRTGSMLKKKLFTPRIVEGLKSVTTSA